MVEQAEAEVVPSSSLVKVEMRLRLRLRMGFRFELGGQVWGWAYFFGGVGRLGGVGWRK